MKKSKTRQTSGDVNESTLKSRRRQALLTTVARRLLNDPSASWSDVGTAFTQELLDKKWDDNLTEAAVREIIGSVVKIFDINVREILKSLVKSPADVKAALSASRGTRKR